jgi:hypothetical protein
METRLTALKNFVLGKDKVEAGEPFETDPATAARLVQKGIASAGEPPKEPKKKAGKKKAAKKAGEKK